MANACLACASRSAAPAATPRADASAQTSAEMPKLQIAVNGHTLTATLAENSSAEALVKLLEQGPVTVNASDYGAFEKVGALPQQLPQNNTQITTSAGDIILYQGRSICFYYAQNSWNFTRLGRIDGAENLDLRSIYGAGSATFVLSLSDATGIEGVATKADATVVGIFTTDGRRLAQTAVDTLPRGTYIIKERTADGNVRTRKVQI